MNKEIQIQKIIADHQHYINRDCEGWQDMRASFFGDFCHVSFAGEDLRFAKFDGDFKYCNFWKTNLQGAVFAGADLHYANFKTADLTTASFYEADIRSTTFDSSKLLNGYLYGADCAYATFNGADLRNAIFNTARLRKAVFTGADLQGVNFSEADLFDAVLDKKERVRFGQVLDKPMTVYKNTYEHVVITAEVPAGAVVFSINNGKCRTNKARVINMDGHKLLHSQYNHSFEYRLGQEIEIADFNLAYNLECASGFHFFRTRKEAENY